ncbi:MAG: family 78 glycoside hydrolase catalytic domain [Dehalococcoidia bacterium]|nr:family 78 glycoside hydrolase catalytic domain [Dehalococcoidia bacterium]
MQTAYEIAVRRDGGVATTGRIDSDASVLVPWPFAPLTSRGRCDVRVRVWGDDGAHSDWSAPLAIEAGLLDPSDWRARFVSAADEGAALTAPLLRREFELRPGAVRARLYVSALGVYECELNGRRVGDHVLAPGWTSYDHRLRYQTFDVLDLLQPADNAIGATLGEGWYRGRIGFPGSGGRELYGDRLALLAQLEVAYKDGSVDVVATDRRWRSAPGPILASGIYDGETYDARREAPGWSRAGFDDSAWGDVAGVERDLGTLVAPDGPPLRRIDELAAVAVLTSPSGKTIVDFGQNIAGRLRIAVAGAAGQTVTLRHAEVLQDGELCTTPLRGAQATDRYTLRGGGPETWEPRFTYHGFRYAEVDGWPGTLTLDALRAVVCHSDIGRSGWFECSEPLLNRFHENVVWSMKANFFDVPTDCPQRDERLGWTGDLTVFSPAACYLHDVAGFLASWLADLAADQHESGIVPVVVPDVLSRHSAERGGALNEMAQAVWGDAAVIVPWLVYERYGDRALLEAQYDSMRRWVDVVAMQAGPRRLWARGFQFGDWLDPGAPPDEPQRAMTDAHLVATAYFAHVAGLLSRIAGVLDRDDDRARYRAVADEAAAAFRAEYVTPAGRIVSDTQTAYALALRFGLLETDDQRRRAGRRLASLVRRNGYRVGTGFAGTAHVLDALCDAGEVETAFRMITERACPSWLYPVTMGATTVWERWDSLRPDGRVNVGQMTSFNHYALGAAADWLQRRVGGLAPIEPGYRRFEVRPLFGAGVTSAKSELETPYGRASSRWRLDGTQMELAIAVPPNTRARVVSPGGGASIEVGSGAYRWTFDVSAVRPETGPGRR